ncbi:unnamed protein product [Parascedosporium putredinis]|uniref:RRM domain-containing protein n=1 Tax=Parascedosporium putredinis TaxID=1442378 RepID=A0A9P1H9F6_9PEZI|nr:unnamed protein product [Parascedosporium putredinis]CAI8003038.1 unnamed protein product [Parascedosporium putredinis]
MAPKKKEAPQKMSLGDFLNDSSFGGSWADEVEDTIGTQPLPPTEHSRGGMGSSYGGYGSYGGDRGDRGDRGYPPRDSGPQQLPTRPPYTAHLGNLPYDATVEAVNDFLPIVGFAYVEFQELDGLKKALDLDGQTLNGRYIKVKIADPPRDRGGGDSGRDLSDWTRKGPLADLPRGNERREFGERRQVDFSERRAPREPPVDDGKVRDFGNWERKGPLSPLPQAEAPAMSREGSRARNNADPLRNRHQSPSWGEGRPEGAARPEGGRPQREPREKPERTPTAAERDMQWRSNMRTCLPAPAPAVVASRPKLNLAKRTVSEAPDAPSPTATGDSKASPFGGARPIDTMAREREIEEKRLQALKEKKESEEKAKEERRLAKEAAAKEAAEKEAADKEAAEKEAEDEAASSAVPTTEDEPSASVASEAEPNEKTDDSTSKDQKSAPRSRESKEPKEPKEGRPDFKSRATESGNWLALAAAAAAVRVAAEVRAPRAAGQWIQRTATCHSRDG